MQVKLTLRLEKDLIEQVKDFARKNNTSLSKIVAKYFRNLSKNNPISKSPILSEITGIIKSNKEPEELIEEYKKHLEEKYL